VRPASNGSNHHRYGEVKTRLTIDASDDFANFRWIILQAQFLEIAMPTRVMSNGRVTVPKRVRDYLGIEPGTEVAFRRATDGSIVIERADGTRPPSRFAKLVGSAGLGPSTDEIMAMLRGD
jgi:antitoxin PrlF